MAITGMVTRTRRRMYEAIIGLPQVSGGLRHAPAERHRPLDDSGHVLAPRGVTQEEAGRRINDILERGLVEPADGGLFLIESPGVEPCRDFLFDGFTIRPTIPRFVTAGPNCDIDRGIDAVRTRMPGVEHLPASLAMRRLLSAACTDCRS